MGQDTKPVEPFDSAALVARVTELEGQVKALQSSVDSFNDLKAEAIADAVQAQLAKHPLMQEAARRAEAAAAADKAHAEAEAKDRKAAKASEKARVEAEAKRNEALDNAHSEFEAAMEAPFIGDVAGILPKTVKELRFDDGESFSIDHVADINPEADLRMESDGVVVTKAIALAADEVPFMVRGVTLLTDGGALRVEINPPVRAGGGSGANFPAGHIKIRPLPPTVEAEPETAE